MQYKLLAIGLSMFLSSSLSAQLHYPITPQRPVIDDYFGTKVTDPYRWLEDDNSPDTKAWVIDENKVTQQYLSSIPFRDKVRARLETLWNYPKYSSPFKKNEWYYFYKNNGLQNQSVLYRQKGLDGTPEIFFDPNLLSTDGTVALGNLSMSKHGKFAAYTVSASGSDWEEAYVKDVATGQILPDHLQWLKFTGLSWKGDEGFYYSRFPTPVDSSKMVNQNQFHKVYYHVMGTLQSEDKLIYEDNAHPLRTAYAGPTEDNRFLILGTTEGTSGSEIWIKDLTAPDTGFSLLVPGFNTDAGIVDNVGGQLLVLTNDHAPNFKLVQIDPQHPGRDNWITIIPEKPEVLQSVSTGGGFLFASYLKDASSRADQFTYSGQLVREIQLPGIGDASGFGGEKADSDFFYSYTSINYPPAIFHYNVGTGQSTLFHQAEVALDPDQFEIHQVFFTSKDGAKVPMFLSYRKGLVMNGQNPVLIYGYGGFNIPMTPTFSITQAFWMAQGGIYAQVTLRGGNEYGEAWHKAGMLHNKQNVFNDMIGAAEYLIAEKYTNKEKIAIRGGSNGGLLIGACMTQRPDLFKVAIAQVGVMDMLRFQKFTIGWAWVVEYGSSDHKEDFDYLYHYSPYHNLRPGVSYPATLVTTADHDDRVVPAHSFKFAARLQADNAGPNPVLIRIDSKAGHGGGKPTSKTLDEQADIWSFVMYNLGMTYP
jgi:prolyl oligopeptidase